VAYRRYRFRGTGAGWLSDCRDAAAESTEAENAPGVLIATLPYVSIQHTDCSGVEPLHRSSTTYRRVEFEQGDRLIASETAQGVSG
jgi:hypothetical protein